VSTQPSQITDAVPSETPAAAEAPEAEAPEAPQAPEASKASQEDDRVFHQVMQEVLASDEITNTLGAGSEEQLTALRKYLTGRRDKVSSATEAERKQWREAAKRYDDPRAAVQAEHKDEQTFAYRFIFTPLIWLFLAAAASVVLLLFVGYPIANSLHAAGAWRDALWAALGVCAGTFVVDLILVQVIISWVANREKGAYLDAANAAEKVYADVLRKSLLGEAREWVNKVIKPPENDQLVISGRTGLAEVYNAQYMIPSEASKQLADVLKQLSGGGTIGLAGPRGAGKTCLIREYSRDQIDADQKTGVIAVRADAPVQYQPYDFLLRLLKLLYQGYLKFHDVPYDSDRLITASRIPASGLRAWWRSVERWWRSRRKRADQAGPVSAKNEQLIREAQDNLQRIAAQWSRTTTLGASVSAPGNIAGATEQVAATATERPWNYTELVDEFRRFLTDAAVEMHGSGKAGGHVIVSIDEIDKISDGQQAQRFVNELKAVLGVPHCYYLISVSDDALAAYEMRGLPMRDAFDSAFDEVIHVRYFRLADSGQMLRKRVIGMPDAFIRLCHCLSGGLPRDLIRVARHAVIAAERGEDTKGLAAVCQQLVLEDLRRKLDAAAGSWAGRPARKDGRATRKADGTLFYEIQRLVAVQPDDLDTGRELRAGLEPVLARVALEGGSAPSPELAAYLYYLLTLLDVFTPGLSQGHIVDGAGKPAPDGAFDQLCLARQTLGTDPRWAWLTIESFRETWGLKPPAGPPPAGG